MIIDYITDAAKYYHIHEHVATALKWIERHQKDFQKMENGQYHIDGENVYAIINSYDTKPLGDCGWEGHLRYCDIHYSISGSERIGYSHKSHMLEIQPYDLEKDYALYTGSGDWLTVREQSFCLLLPQDIHAPGAIAGEHSIHLKKVVIKLLAWQ